jgi:hypothetical protein
MPRLRVMGSAAQCRYIPVNAEIRNAEESHVRQIGAR